MKARVRSAARLLGLAAAAASAAIGGAAEAAPAKKAPAGKAAPAGSAGVVKLTVHPEAVTLSGRGSSQRFMVFGHYADGRKKDVTAQAAISKAGKAGIQLQPGKAGAPALVTASTDGEVKVVATVGKLSAAMKVTVQDAAVAHTWSFANEIVPIFTKAGCNTGGCHGSPSGRGGFRLSLFGYEPDYDFDMVTKEKNGDRIDRDRPAASLLLQKPSGKVPHGGGLRFKEGSEFYTRIADWLKAGAPKQPEFDPRLQRIEIYPTDWTLSKPAEKQQILVVAFRDDGTSQDVTQYARFDTNDDQVVSVDEDGVMEATGKGETSIMIRYLGGVGIVRVNVPRDPVPASAFDPFKPVNYIDQLVLEKLKETRVPPSGPASDEEFLRRAYIDTAGMTPSVEEARQFLDSKDPNKRAKLIDQLLNRPEFVDYWTLKWSDLLRNNQQVKQPKGLQVFYRWIRDSIRENKPYNEFARELITASGSSYRNGPVNWYNTGEFGGEYPLFLASQTSQVFLGVRIDCARCHNHPFEAWSQVDYYGLAGFFARTKLKNGVDQDERIFYAGTDGDVRHPRTNVVIQPKLLGGDVATFGPDDDRRERLANWIVSPSNPWFKSSVVNRLWNNFFGRGIVHPVDDYRLTNPASNEKLLAALADRLVAYRWDLRAIMRDILMSRTYQATSVPNKWNVDDRQYNSRALPRRLYAEVLLDAIVYATDVPEKFGPYEPGRRAISIPDNRVQNGFLDLFGRARREVACECERPEETNVAMVLNLLNGGTVNGRITHPNGRVGRLVKANKPPGEIIEELYLATLARRPNAKEQAAAEKLFSQAPSLKEGAEDLMWGLLNMREFLLNH